MRIISGKLKAIRFNPPKGFPSRPTTDFAKEGLFNVLEHRFSLYDLRILDLFAGTGNISFEFASREAGEILAIDKNPRCVRFIRDMAKKHDFSEDIHCIQAEVLKMIPKLEGDFDIVFADPPFDFQHYDELVRLVQEHELIAENGTFVLEHSHRTKLDHLPGFQESKKYGNVVFSFFN
jgi:16S rRNA (guanine(966)-N(2))-methyltransferase RsmD